MRNSNDKMIPISLGLIPGKQLQFNVSEKALQMVEELLEKLRRELLLIVSVCESPIEQLMAIALFDQIEINDKKNEIFICPQQHIGDYRVDFIVQIIHTGPDGYPSGIENIVVECDGHDFHEKTKEQAKKDKVRDRFFQSAGYTVLHFTGSEIWNEPHKCAKEVIHLAIVKLLELRGDD